MLTQAALQPVVEQAIVYWADQGVDADRVQDLQAADVQVAALPGSILGTANELTNTIRLDDDAARYGWVTNDLDEKNAAIEGVDLLSAVVHEFGHLLGYGHDDLGIESLSPGVRYLPDLNPIVGDANGDGLFDSSDLVTVFQGGKYEGDEPATWAEGDWNGDGVFSSSDLVMAMQSGLYERPLEQSSTPQRATDSVFADLDELDLLALAALDDEL